MAFNKNDVIEAHSSSFNNMDELRKSQKCGCFYCLKVFQSDEIEEYIEDEPHGTALCPYCDIDSVIGESAGYPLTEDFLTRMKRYWFDSGSAIEMYTPFGGIRFYLDDKELGFDHRAIDPDPRLFPSVDETHRITITVKNDKKPHTLRITLLNCDMEACPESGELLEAVSFYKNGGKITLGCYASFGDSADYGLDYDGSICSDGIEIEITSETKTREFKFGVCWINNCTDETDVQTWYGADPSIK